jgi:hypothetical protein
MSRSTRNQGRYVRQIELQHAQVGSRHTQNET